MQPFVIVMVNNHGVIVLVMKKNPIPGLHKPIPIIIIIENIIIIIYILYPFINKINKIV